MAGKEIRIKLENVHELFRWREINPLIQEELFVSGMDQLYRLFNSSAASGASCINVILPKDQITSDTGTAVKGAIVRYCDYYIYRTKEEKQILQREGLQSFFKGLLFLTVCLSISYILQKQQEFSEFAKVFFREGLFIVGWVSMWKPVEIFLFDLWTLARKIGIYRKIKKMSIRIIPR